MKLYSPRSGSSSLAELVPAPYLVAYSAAKHGVVGLIVPDPEWALEWAQANGEKFALKALQDLPAFRSAVRAAVDRVNQDLSVIEKVRQFTFADEPFTIDNEELTPKQSIRRHKLKARYGERLDGLYKG